MCIKCHDAFNLLENTFGKDRAEFLLWEMTCYPFDGDKTFVQAQDLVKRDLDDIMKDYDMEWNPPDVDRFGAIAERLRND